MPNPSAASRPLLLAIIAGLAACGLPRPFESHAFVKRGDASSVDIGYSGDAEATTALARRHCAQYEREARFYDKTIDTAFFDCVRR